MKKLNSIVYNKLYLQGEEARDLQMTKLASGILNALGPIPEEESTYYNLEELQNDMYQGLWKLATHVIKYHDVKSVDAEKVHQVLEILASKLIEEIEQSINIDNKQIGAFEEKLIGQEWYITYTNENK